MNQCGFITTGIFGIVAGIFSFLLYSRSKAGSVLDELCDGWTVEDDDDDYYSSSYYNLRKLWTMELDDAEGDESHRRLGGCTNRLRIGETVMLVGTFLWIAASLCLFIFACCRLPRINKEERERLEKKEEAAPTAIASPSVMERGGVIETSAEKPTQFVLAEAIDPQDDSDNSLTEEEMLELVRLKKEEKRKKRQATMKHMEGSEEGIKWEKTDEIGENGQAKKKAGFDQTPMSNGASIERLRADLRRQEEALKNKKKTTTTKKHGTSKKKRNDVDIDDLNFLEVEVAETDGVEMPHARHVDDQSL